MLFDVRLARGRASRWKLGAEEHWVEAGGNRFRVRKLGHGAKTLVLCPDPPNVIESLDAVAKRLSDRMSVIVVELAGFGFSVPGAEHRFGIAATAQSITDLLIALGSGPCTLAFPCVSGLAAVEVARRRPDLVSSLVLIQTPTLDQALRWIARVDRQRLVGTQGLGQAVIAIGGRQVGRAWLRTACADPSVAEALVAISERARDRGALDSLASAFQALAREAGRAQPIATPTLVCWGNRDRTHRRTPPEDTVALSTRSSLVRFPNAGHFPELEDPGLFTTSVFDFLDGLGTG